MQDRFGRQISYLRISVTDRCNLRCLYCMPEEGVAFQPHSEVLRYEEIVRLAQVAVGLGITRLRLTGGEPLVRRDVVDLVRALSHLPGVEEVALTTNATLLAEYARPLKEAGLARVNVSLDSLRPERYREITRGGDLSRVWAGIAAAEEAGLSPIKVNAVIVRGLNDDELEDFVRLAAERNLHVRFIELMALGESARWQPRGYVPSAELKERLAGLLARSPLQKGEGGLPGAGPAEYYQVSPGGTVGFISPVSNHFCQSCNRLRLTAVGTLRPCLLSEREVDVKSALRRGADEAELRRLFLQAVEIKPGKQELPQCCPELGAQGEAAASGEGGAGGGRERKGRLMSQIGG
ncbi:MAG: GTP 3',8-cyclase MoaA [Bacillota bacterium]|nr:GTP 3',8-cyclase MoaA [Bacillota bacterium]